MAKLCITAIDWARIKPEDVIATWTLPVCEMHCEADWWRAATNVWVKSPKKKSAKVV